MKPNLIVILADQLRRDVLGKGFSPNIDALMSESLQMENMYCGSPLCVPARGCFFTGLYPNNNGSKINPWSPQDAEYARVKEGIPTLYDYLESSYEILHSGKQHLYTSPQNIEERESSITFLATSETYKKHVREQSVSMPGGPTFKSMVAETVAGRYTHLKKYSNPNTGVYPFAEEYFHDVYYTDQAITGIKKRKDDKPLFLSMMYVSPHPPFSVPEPYFSALSLDDVKLPENVGIWYENQSPLQMYNLTGIIGSQYNMENWREAWRVYIGMVMLLDKQVGRLIDCLKEEGVFDNSTIVFSSDHGEMLGSHSLFQKMCMYEESVHVPFSIRFPQAEYAGQKDTVIHSHTDVLPSLLEVLNIPLRHETDGTSFIPHVDNEVGKTIPIFIQYDGNGSLSNFQRAVLADGYKLIVDIFKDEEFLSLYDLSLDPQEKQNLLFDPGFDIKTQHLYGLLSEHLRKTGDALKLQGVHPEAFRTAYKSE